MRKEVEFELSAETAEKEDYKKVAAEYLCIAEDEIKTVRTLKKSIDARTRDIKVKLKLEVFINESPPDFFPSFKKNYPDISDKPSVIIVGSGPAGLFAALRLIELGVKPIVLERGKNVRDRRRDLALLNKIHLINSDSNYCFGEGGAGTYSDGKLYTRSKKRGNIINVMETFVAHGADPSILVEAHPHIGTNKLPKVVTNLRESIIKAGGEVHFNTKVTDLIIKNSRIQGVIAQSVQENGEKSKEYIANAVILATGHSGREMVEWLFNRKIQLEFKPFAVGVRAEHPQALIDSIQYHCKTESEVVEKRKYLPAASYALVEQVENRGVYSFCMCPGGIIAPCATQPGEVVTNGWSPSKRNNPFANSGIVVSVTEEDVQQYKKYGVLAGLRFQQATERVAFEVGGKTQTAPAQRMVDFVNNKISASLPQCSYPPGIKSALLHEILPYSVKFRLQEAFKLFGKKMKGYLTNEALLVAVESRTSSPVRIPRDKETFEHPQVNGLYPCGEGAGYAGGIISAAIDGQLCAEKCALKVKG